MSTHYYKHNYKFFRLYFQVKSKHCGIEKSPSLARWRLIFCTSCILLMQDSYFFLLLFMSSAFSWGVRRSQLASVFFSPLFSSLRT